MKECGINLNCTCMLRQTIRIRTYLVEEMVNPIGNIKRAKMQVARGDEKANGQGDTKSLSVRLHGTAVYTDPYVR